MFGITGKMQDVMLAQVKANLQKNGVKTLLIKADSKGNFAARAYKEEAFIMTEGMLLELKETNENLYKRIVSLNTPDEIKEK